MNYIIGIAGGSGSGKTTFAKRLTQHLDQDSFSFIGQDSYYRDQSHLFDEDGGKINFDHPDSLEFELLSSHLSQLKKNNEINVPVYDYVTHKRLEQTINIAPNKYIFVDGTLLFSQSCILSKLDLKIYVDAPEELRFERRLKRDMTERGRTEEGVINQFSKQVKPMHDLFIEPSKKEADILVMPENFDELVNKVKLTLLKI